MRRTSTLVRAGTILLAALGAVLALLASGPAYWGVSRPGDDCGRGETCDA